MEALRKKLNSSRGASILLALLFLLVCMMVGASVLMAAVSNAGKLRGNREEHQKYLTLSSALTLLCDELESVEYVGKYEYLKLIVEEYKIVDSDSETGEPIYGWEPDHNRHFYWQKAGELRSTKDSMEWQLNKVLPLFHDLDKIFAAEFTLPPSRQVPPTDEFNAIDFHPLTEAEMAPQGPHEIVFQLNDAGSYGGLKSAVTIKAELNAKGEITLTAALGGLDSEYIMEAKLVPNDKPEDVLVLSESPKKQADAIKTTRVSRGQQIASPEGECKLNETEKTLTWTLDHIVKKEKEAEGG